MGENRSKRKPTLEEKWRARHGPNKNAFSDDTADFIINTAKITPIVAPQLTGATVGLGLTAGAGFKIYQGAKAFGDLMNGMSGGGGATSGQGI